MKLKTLYKSVVEHAIHVAVLVRLIPTPDHIDYRYVRMSCCRSLDGNHGVNTTRSAGHS